jgi:hypothetical protein
MLTQPKRGASCFLSIFFFFLSFNCLFFLLFFNIYLHVIHKKKIIIIINKLHVSIAFSVSIDYVRFELCLLS